MNGTEQSVYGIKLLWGTGSKPEKGVGFSERAYHRWKDCLPVRTRMLIYRTSRNRGPTSMSIASECEVCGTFKDGECIPEYNPEHTRMLPVRWLHTEESSTPVVRLSRIREVLENDKWPHQGLSWQPVSREIYETLLAELRGEGKSA